MPDSLCSHRVFKPLRSTRKKEILRPASRLCRPLRGAANFRPIVGRGCLFDEIIADEPAAACSYDVRHGCEASDVVLCNATSRHEGHVGKHSRIGLQGASATEVRGREELEIFQLEPGSHHQDLRGRDDTRQIQRALRAASLGHGWVEAGRHDEVGSAGERLVDLRWGQHGARAHAHSLHALANLPDSLRRACGAEGDLDDVDAALLQGPREGHRLCEGVDLHHRHHLASRHAPDHVLRRGRLSGRRLRLPRRANGGLGLGLGLELRLRGHPVRGGAAK
mmetsp:Transcript_76222/g.218390  ORF Transcript_76222/g.218390 Transcript_76222/m.218390 type:complete len:279 (+) Transcript_76222:243-1079(+)